MRKVPKGSIVVFGFCAWERLRCGHNTGFFVCEALRREETSLGHVTPEAFKVNNAIVHEV